MEAAGVPSSLAPPDIPASLVEAQIASGVRWLRFSPTIEQAYERETSERHIRQMTVTALIGLFLYDAFLLADYLMIPDVMDLAVIVRMGVVTPLSALLYVIMQHARGVVMRNMLAAINVLMVIGSTAYLLQSSASPHRILYNQAVLLAFIYVCMIQRLRFWYAVGTCFAGHVILTVTLLEQNLDVRHEMLPIELTMIIGTVFVIAAAYSMEREHRMSYLINLRERLHAAAMEGISNRDALTGLLNRRALDRRLFEIADPAREWSGQLAVIILDIDHFKIYNDRLGHQAGDDCLRQVASVILSELGNGHEDAFRFGGEEFLVLVDRTDRHGAVELAERIRAALEARALPHPESSTGPCVTASFGVAFADVLQVTPAELIARADMALYAAKNSGRNRVWPPHSLRSAEPAGEVPA